MAGAPRRRTFLLTAALVVAFGAAAVWIASGRAPPPPAVWVSPPVPQTLAAPMALPAFTVALTPGGRPEDLCAIVAWNSDAAGTRYTSAWITLVPAPGLSDIPRILVTRDYATEGREIGEYVTAGETTVVGGATWEKWTLQRKRKGN